MDNDGNTQTGTRKDRSLEDHSHNNTLVWMVIVGLFLILLFYFFLGFSRLDNDTSDQVETPEITQDDNNEYPAVKTYLFEGALLSVDTEAMSLTLKSPSDDSKQTFYLEPETRILRNFTDETNTSVTEINLTDLSESEELAIMYTQKGSTFRASTIDIFDQRTFEEYRLVAEIPQLLSVALLDVSKDAIIVKLPDPIVDLEVRPYPTSTIFAISPETRMWKVQDASRKHIRHTWESATFDDFNTGDEVVLELDRRNVRTIVLLPNSSDN